MSMERELQDYINQEILLDAEQAIKGPHESLVSSGRVDSLGLLRVAQFVQERYGVDIMTLGGPDDFETVEAIVAVIRAHRP